MIASILPDINLDYPEASLKWKEYLNNYDIGKSVPKLPEATTNKEKLFITGRNIYTTYYNVKNLEERLAKYTIRAPFSGALTEALVTEGTLVRGGQKLGSYIDPGAYEMQVSIPSSYSQLLKAGKQVTLSNIENTKQYTGKVIRVNENVDLNSQTISAFIEISNDELKEGMYLQANLFAKNVEDAIEVPRSLLLEGNKIFYVSNDSILKTLDVEPVYFSEKQVVLKGVPDETKIITKAVQGGYDGMLVSIQNQAGAVSNKNEE